MKNKLYSCMAAASAVCLTLLVAWPGWAEVPAPPANQQLGIDDTIFNDMAEADCRLCHDDPAVVGPTPNVDRHHLLYGAALPQGECAVNRNACLSDADCDAAICTRSGAACAVDSDCPDYSLGETCGEMCVGETLVPNLDADQDGVNDTSYACLSCHAQDTSGGVINFLVERDCLQCHVQVPGEASVHHLTAVAQGFDSPLGDPAIGDCTPCHGTLVDDVGDGHAIPTYTPSLVTPKINGGTGEPLNSRGNGAGACDYCHDSGTDSASGVLAYTNGETHHNTGLYLSAVGVFDFDRCIWCHDLSAPAAEKIRRCEDCHGMESLHNIQVDSDNNGSVTVGQELVGYGHVGRDMGPGDSDCWGCHGFGMASAPDTGPIAPSITGTDVRVMTTGTAVTVTLSGTAFTSVAGATEWTSVVELTAADGSAVTLPPETISESSLTVTIPGTMPAGNYEIRVVKATAQSNPVGFSVKPAVAISEAMCNACLGLLTISGSGFGDAPPAGAETYINVEQDGVRLDIGSWTDTQIQALGASCDWNSITVNALFGSAGE